MIDTEKSKNVEFRTHVVEELKSLHDCIDRLEKSFAEYKSGLGSRLQTVEEATINHAGRIGILEVTVAALVKVWWCIAAASIGLIVTAFWKLVMK